MTGTIDYDRAAAEYAQHRQVHPEVLRSLVVDSGLDGGSTMLEVGCGTGNYVLALEQQVGPACWGVDPSEGMLTQARARSGGVRFLPGRAERLDFLSGFFDLVFSVDVVHHVEDRRAFFGEAYRVLKNGGRLCTVTDSESIIRRRQPLAVYFPETVPVELERYPRIAQLRSLMEGAGFGALSEEMVEFPYELTELQPYRDKAFSSLHLISEEAFQRGIKRLEQDLRAGPIPCVSRYTLIWGRK